MITLYGNGLSRSFRALWALEEVNAKYIYHSVKFGSNEALIGTLSHEYKKLNFQGKVPTFIENEIVITESAAILNYIAATHPLLELAPLHNRNLRAKYDEVCFFVLSDLEQSLWTNGKHRFVLPEKYRISEVLPTTIWEFKQSLKALEDFLSDKEFIIGENFTMADILVAHTLTWAINFHFDVPKELLQYKKRMYERPACLRACKLV